MSVLECFIGIDLGSTTTKAIILDKNQKILGRGITNSRSNYDIACQIASEEAEINSRLAILQNHIREDAVLRQVEGDLLEWLLVNYKLAQHRVQLEALKEAALKDPAVTGNTKDCLEKIFECLFAEAEALFQPDVKARSDFFRDIASSGFMTSAENLAKNDSVLFDRLISIFDRTILQVESKSYANIFKAYMEFACEQTVKRPEFGTLEGMIRGAIKYAVAVEFQPINTIGTGYGRARLPFPKHQIRSEILCHGLGAHYMFPGTRTVLDIGGQDTKAIQIDEHGIVTNFQMNDRCAAGCGRYLGYIADEMNMGVHELGPIAMKSTKQVRINSTCTVFAGTELRERLALGEKREDILAGLHRAMILRAMSLLARSGGIDDEFTFTGGVAKNAAATSALIKLVEENYGKKTINISADSIYTGALGAALFAKRDHLGETVNVDLKKLKKQKTAAAA